MVAVRHWKGMTCWTVFCLEANEGEQNCQNGVTVYTVIFDRFLSLIMQTVLAGRGPMLCMAETRPLRLR